MIHDTDGPDRRAFEGRVFDVCVIGSGPAGISLARALAAHGHAVALMEGGGLDWSPESQDLYVGETAGDPTPDLDGARLRFFGGTSYHWNGRCRALDASDFAANPVNAMGGWPIGRADLEPYAAATEAILDISPSPAPPDAAPDPDAPGLHRVRFQRSGTPETGPVRFGAFLDEIAASEGIALGLHANLVDLRLAEDFAGADAPAIVGAVFRGYEEGDPGFTVEARHYVLAAGGIETPRLLLNCTGQIATGLGNGHDLVGRFFMDHPTIRIGEIAYAGVPESERALHYAPSVAFMAAEGTLNFVHSTRWARRAPLPFFREAARSVQCELPFADRIAEAVLGERAMNCDFPGGLGQWWARRDPDRDPHGPALVEIEQLPDPDNRVALVEARDALGLRRVRVDWRVGETDLHTAQAAAFALGGHLAEHGIGRLQVSDWLAGETPRVPDPDENERLMSSWHHMGTTRMADDPRRGVVDRHCRVHGVANLHVAGSSVFATSGYANPTYTIVQLALRLADRLHKVDRA